MVKIILLGAAIIGSGLVAGLLYGWAVSVNPGLRRVPDPTYVTTMQGINRAIINPLFVIPFLAMPAVLAAAAIAQFRSGDSRRGLLLASAAGVYLLGVLGITVGGNVPLNNALDTFAIGSATNETLATRRETYETPWVRWHNVRTLASIVSFALASASAIVAESD